MYKTLRGESMRIVLPRLMICLILAVGLLAVSGGGLLKLAIGPKRLSDQNSGDLKGRYVRFDASEVIVAFASLSASDADGNSHVMETYYLLPLGDNQYIAVMDQKEKNSSVLDRAMEQSHEYYMGDLETLHPLGDLSGTVVPLDEEMMGFMSDCIDTYQLPGYEEGRDSSQLLLPYQVNLDKVGFLGRNTALILGGAALFFLALLAIQLAVVLSGGYQRKVRAILGEGDADFETARKIERVRVGQYIWYAKGPGSRVLKTENLVWGYAMPEPLVVSKYRWPVALYDMDRNLTRVEFMEQKNCEAFLDAIAAQGHPFHQGYTSALSDQFQNDFEGFLQAAAREADQKRNSSQT